MGTLLIANYLQLKKADPVNMTVITGLVEKLYENPADSVLRTEIRTLDLLSRKAYFTSIWQVKTGGYFLLAAVALMVISFQVIEYRKKINPVISTDPIDEIFEQRQKARNWIVIGGSLFLVVAVVFGVLSSNELAGKFITLSGGQIVEPTEESQSVTQDVAVSTQAAVAEVTPSSVVTEGAVIPAAPVTVSSDNYPNFRGEGGRGVVSKKDIPVSWDGATGNNILWKTEIPLQGNNSPIVWGDKVFLAGSDGKKQEVYGIDRNSGKILWTAVVGSGTKTVAPSAETGYSASTAVTDGIGVYVIFPTGDIAAIDLNGKKIWERDLGLPDNHYGHASSLMLYNGNIILQLDQKTSPRIMALSTKTGSTVWSTDRPVKLSWTSPIVVNTGSRDEVMTVCEPYVISYNPTTGKELWRIECISGEVGASLAYANGIVFSVNEYSNLCAIKLGAQPSILWQNNELLSDIPSPVATDKYLFMTTSYGVMVCYDAVTGEKQWEHDFGKPVYSSPILVGNNIYVSDMTGIMHIFAADKEYKQVGEPKLGEGTVTTAAFTNGRIYIRGEKNLYCIGK